MFEEGLNLLPCPHCGKPATLWAVDMSEGVYVFCDNCGMRGPLTEEMTESAAISAWNALPRRSDVERVELERDWLIDYMLNKCICYYTDEAKKYCQSQDDCDECQYMGREAWLKAIKEAVKCGGHTCMMQDPPMSH